MKKIAVVVLTLIFLLIPMIVNAGFSDVPDDHWAKEYINDLADKGVINGYTDGRYGPSDTLTNGQFLKLIALASISDEEFLSLRSSINHWSASYFENLKRFGIFQDAKISISEENLDEPISRMNVVKILSLCDLKIRENSQKTVYVLKFNDIDDFDTLDKTLLSHAVGAGIINGYEDMTFKPNNQLTRAEAAKIMYVYMNQGGNI